MFNPAQHLLLAIGVSADILLLGASKDRRRSPSFTKRGPGRRHPQPTRQAKDRS